MARTIPFFGINDSDSTTARLMKMLDTSPGSFLKEQLPTIKDTTFSEYLYKLMEEHGRSIPDMIKDACISKPYTYQFINGDRLPGRDIILRIGICMQLSLDDIQRLLTLAGKSILYPKLRRDAGILFCIKKRMSLDETNFFLADMGEVPLI